MLELKNQLVADGAIPMTEAEICEKVLGQGLDMLKFWENFILLTY